MNYIKKGPKLMLAGVDTGFFFALEIEHPIALSIWEEKEIVTSTVVLYEIQKKLLQGNFKEWPSIMEDIEASIEVAPLTKKIASRAAHLSYGLGIPGLDALILGTLLEKNCEEIYTTDFHFELYRKKDIKIVNLGI